MAFKKNDEKDHKFEKSLVPSIKERVIWKGKDNRRTKKYLTPRFKPIIQKISYPDISHITT